MKLLLLEDEDRLRESVQEFLEEIGFSVYPFSDGQKALDSIFTGKYDILVMDVQVPGIIGFDILKEIRSNGIETPALIVSSLTNIRDLTTGYENGCNDYLKKPFELMELKLRIMQALKINNLNTTKQKIDLPNGYTYDTANFKLFTPQNIEIQLTKTEKDILELLIKKVGTVVSVKDFQKEVWNEDIDSSNIRVQINNLRKKIGTELIKNVRGLGYKID